MFKDSFQSPFKTLVFFSLVINALVIISVLALQSKLPPEVPLFYGLAEGEEQLAPAWELVFPNLAAAAVLIINFLISLKTTEDLTKKTLLLTGVAATFFATITTIKIIMLVGSF